MTPQVRRYQTEDDFWCMRELLRAAFVLNGGRERSWHVARLEYARWHMCLNVANVRLEDIAHLWENDGRLIAFTMPDGGFGEAYFCVDPSLDTPELQAEMLRVAQEHLAETAPDGARRLCIWVPQQDSRRQELLRKGGYSRGEWLETQWCRDLNAPIPDVPAPPGYVIGPMGDGVELLERCYASGLAFHDGDIQIAVQNREDPTWYRNIQRAPSYRRDLDLVAVASDGAVAAFSTIWFDDVTRSAYFEPVGTVPSHQRRGLGRLILTEGLKRLQRIGATRAFVSGMGPGANALYASVFGPDYELNESWVREWRS
jgi:GNAT superfamily N-acetyltransferase